MLAILAGCAISAERGHTSQLAGLNWLLEMHQKGLNPILADEMGLGKTVQSISLLACVSFMPREMCSEIAPHLVVVPLTVLGNWA